jgi:hypothetical protein
MAGMIRAWLWGLAAALTLAGAAMAKEGGWPPIVSASLPPGGWSESPRLLKADGAWFIAGDGGVAALDPAGPVQPYRLGALHIGQTMTPWLLGQTDRRGDYFSSFPRGRIAIGQISKAGGMALAPGRGIKGYPLDAVGWPLDRVTAVVDDGGRQTLVQWGLNSQAPLRRLLLPPPKFTSDAGLVAGPGGLWVLRSGRDRDGPCGRPGTLRLDRFNEALQRIQTLQACWPASHLDAGGTFAASGDGRSGPVWYSLRWTRAGTAVYRIRVEAGRLVVATLAELPEQNLDQVAYDSASNGVVLVNSQGNSPLYALYRPDEIVTIVRPHGVTCGGVPATGPPRWGVGDVWGRMHLFGAAGQSGATCINVWEL